MLDARLVARYRDQLTGGTSTVKIKLTAIKLLASQLDHLPGSTPAAINGVRSLPEKRWHSHFVLGCPQLG